MKEMILPKDELICDILDREYVKEESQYKRPPSTFKLLTKKPVDSDHFQAQVSFVFLLLTEFFMKSVGCVT